MDEEGDIADGPNGPIIYQNGRWVPMGKSRPTPLTPARTREATPQTAAQAEKDRLDVTNAELTPQNTKFGQASKLRDDYNRDPAVKAYAEAAPIYASALKAGADPSGDQLLINSFAKILDPVSVVREGEYNTVANSDTTVGRLLARAQNEMQRSGSLSPEIRTSIRGAMLDRMGALNSAYSLVRQDYRTNAERNGLVPEDVIGSYRGAPYAEDDRAYWEGQGYRIAGDQPAAQQQAQGQPSATVDRSARITPKPGQYEEGKAPPQLTSDAQIRFSTDSDKKFAGALRQAFRDGTPTFADLEGIRQDFAAQGFAYPPLIQSQWQPLIDRRRKGQSVDSNIGVPQSGVENRTPMQQGASSFLKSEAGATAIGGANSATLGLFDEGAALAMTAGNDKTYAENLERANTMKQLIRNENPGWFAAGEIGGSLVPGVAATKALGGLGVNIGTKALSPSAVGLDAALSGAYGAGEDNEDRGRGAVTGLMAGAAGGAVGRGGLNQAGRMVAPNAGPLNPLYAAGVRPTPGQRFGGAVGTTEEALSSVPVLGGFIRGARQGARDEFETGAFNQALGDIGKALPADAPLGTEAHKFTQEAFNNAYKKARKRMNFVRDADFDKDVQAILTDAQAGGLSDEAFRRLQGTIAAQIDRRAPAGVMDGAAFKKASSALGARISRIRNSPSADQELGDALEGVNAALEQAARRNSHPKAVAALDAVDTGYAKLVRIEEAAKQRGEAGRFSPAQFDSAVQSAAGGKAARSKAYLRGDALMQDYATAGRSLMDRLPNSGTADRQLLAGGGLAGLATVSPGTALVTAGATLPYGLHKYTGGLMAPRTSPALNRIGGWLGDLAPVGGNIMRQLTEQKNIENQRRTR